MIQIPFTVDDDNSFQNAIKTIDSPFEESKVTAFGAHKKVLIKRKKELVIQVTKWLWIGGSSVKATRRVVTIVVIVVMVMVMVVMVVMVMVVMVVMTMVMMVVMTMVMMLISTCNLSICKDT